MVISEVVDAGYAMDGGSILLRFRDSRRRRHMLHLTQTLIPLPRRLFRPRNGDIHLDTWNITRNAKRLVVLRDAIAAFLANDARPEQAVPLPPNSMVLGDDLNELMTKDEVGWERLLLRWAHERIETALAALHA